MCCMVAPGVEAFMCCKVAPGLEAICAVWWHQEWKQYVPYGGTRSGSNMCHMVEGYMQDKIIASHTCFGGHMDVNC